MRSLLVMGVLVALVGCSSSGEDDGYSFEEWQVEVQQVCLDEAAAHDVLFEESGGVDAINATREAQRQHFSRATELKLTYNEAVQVLGVPTERSDDVEAYIDARLARTDADVALIEAYEEAADPDFVSGELVFRQEDAQYPPGEVAEAIGISDCDPGYPTE